MKTCSRCSTTYEPYGQRCSLCRDCKRAYDREYHQRRSRESKSRKQKLQIDRIKENQRQFFEFLITQKCEKCGNDDHEVLEFDHIDRDEKSGNISEMVRGGYSLDVIMDEVRKCRVLCANCHRKWTRQQLGWMNHL